MAIPYGRQRAFLAALLLFSIGSLLTISLHPTFSTDQDKEWIPSRRKPWSTDREDPAHSSSSTQPSADLTGSMDEPATGNTIKIAPDPDVSKLPPIGWLKSYLRDSFLDISKLDENLEDPMRPVRGKAAAEQSRLRLEESDSNNDSEVDEDDEVEDEDEIGNSGNSSEEPIVVEDEGNTDTSSTLGSPQEPAAEENHQGDIHNEEDMNSSNGGDGLEKDEEDNDTTDDEDDEEAKALREKEQMDQAEVDDELGGDGEVADEEDVEVTDVQSDGDETVDDEDDSDNMDDDEEEEEQVSRDRSLADFDLNNNLSTDESYMLFIPSGDTIEQQFYSLVTALWMARHSNRTLLIPPPIIPSPVLQPLLAPDFVAQKRRLVWSSYYDLRWITRAQKIKFLDSVRQRLPLTFSDAMLQEETEPSSQVQETPDQVKELQLTWTPIQCHGPPTAGTWKRLDFAGRHFLNSYGFQANFQILGDRYWDLDPAAIHKHWRYIPSPLVPASSLEGVQDDRDRDHHQQLICISGADQVGLDNPEMEERIWEEVGSLIRFSKATIDKANTGIARALRGLERTDRMHGFIGVHFEKMPPKEVCNPGLVDASSQDGKDLTVSLPPSPSSSMYMQCRWTVEMVSKRIAMLQQEEGKSRPVVVTTTETDPEILRQMDNQPGWLRIEHGVDDDEGAVGLFDPLGLDTGDSPNEATQSALSTGYAHQVARARIHSAAAIFVGSRSSPFDVHVAFRIKYEGRLKTIPPRWELY
ncbi:hypothetical protein BGW42_002805 [Actinomortierella wolfii]|nr:hypothetical protein BGW42_002805 [Actinomortierella wolfii]